MVAKKSQKVQRLVYWVTVCTGLLSQCNGTGVPRNSRSPGVGLEFNVNGTIITRDRFGPGQVSYIDNREGLHKIKNNGNELAVSLHVYSPACDINKHK